MEFESPDPAAVTPPGSCHQAVVTEDGPRPSTRAGNRSRRLCHPRAISSGHERYAALKHGHFEEAGGLGARR